MNTKVKEWHVKNPKKKDLNLRIGLLNKIPFVGTMVVGPVLYLETGGGVFEEVHETSLELGVRWGFH